MSEEESIFDEINENQLVIYNQDDNNVETTSSTDSSLSDDNKNTEVNTEDNVEEDVNDIVNSDENTDSNNGESNDTPDSDDNSDSSSPGYLKAFAKFLYEEGVPIDFKEDEDFKDPAQLTEKIVSVIKSEVEDYKNSLPATVKELINNWEENIPLDKLIGVKSRQIETKNISSEQLEEDTKLQKEVVSKYLNYRGFSKEEIESEIEEYSDLGILYDKAKKHLGNLSKFEEAEEIKIKEEAKIEQSRMEKERAEQLDTIKSTVYKIDNSFIPNVEFTERLKDSIYKSMTEVVSVDNGRPMNDLMAKTQKDRLGFETIVHTLNAIGVFDIDENGKFKPNFKKLMVGTKTNAVKELSKALERNDFKKSSHQASRNDGTFLDEIGDGKLKFNIK